MISMSKESIPTGELIVRRARMLTEARVRGGCRNLGPCGKPDSSRVKRRAAGLEGGGCEGELVGGLPGSEGGLDAGRLRQRS